MQNNNEEKIDSFIFYRSFLNSILRIKDEKYQAEAFKLIALYAFEKIEQESENETVNAILDQAKYIINLNKSKYLTSVKNGKKGGRPRKIKI